MCAASYCYYHHPPTDREPQRNQLNRVRGDKEELLDSRNSPRWPWTCQGPSLKE